MSPGYTEHEPNLTEFRAPITPERLLEANHSPLSKERVAHYQEAKREKDLTYLILCADARSGPSWFNDDRIAAGREIAAGINPVDYQDLLNSEGVGRIAIGVHYDLPHSIENGEFEGCGGLHAFKELNGNSSILKDHPVASHVKSKIHSEHPFVHAFKQKDAIMKQLGGSYKEMVIFGLNHITGLAMPVWSLDKDEEGTYHSHSKIQINLLQNPEFIAPSTLVALSDRWLSPKFQELFQKNHDYVDAMKRANSNYTEQMKVQNPRTIFATTEIKPLRDRYAGLYDMPNQVFVVGMPYIKGQENVRVVTHEDIILSQLSYPILSSLSAKNVYDPFGKTDTLVIETSDIVQSSYLARLFKEQDWARNWIDNRNATIIVVETRLGETTRARTFR